jgi:hypothetical protein
MNFLHTTFPHYTIKQPSGWYENIHFSILWVKFFGFCIKNLENFQKFLLKPNTGVYGFGRFSLKNRLQNLLNF